MRLDLAVQAHLAVGWPWGAPQRQRSSSASSSWG